MPDSEEQIAPPVDSAESAEPPLCRRCNYNLTGLPDKSLCPECAEPIDLSRYSRTWPDALGVAKASLAWWCFVAALGHVLTIAGAVALVALYIKAVLPKLDAAIKRYGA